MPKALHFASRTRLLILFIAVLFGLSIFLQQMYFARSVQAASATVVISQVYGGGGNAGATYKNDFIELFNRGTTTVSLAGWSVQYAASSGTTWQVTNLSGTLLPGQYYLVQEAAGAGGTTNLPTPEASGSIAMSATTGKVALVSSTTTLSGACPTIGVVDFVGFGAANCFEGAGPTATLSNTTAALRAGLGCTDTDSNVSDFSTGPAAPRNTASPTNPCGGTPTPTPTPTLSISDRTVTETNSGTTTATFTVSLSSPAPTGGVTFNIATADGTGPSPATVADNDYVSKSLTAQIIPAGSQTYSFNVTVNGDTFVEANETFLVNVSSVVGATVTDSQGVGTITNDDTATPPGSVVISQIYGGGGNVDAPYTNDYIEIFNRSNASVNLAGWSVQYASSTGSSWAATALSGVIAPGQYYLVREGVGNSCSSSPCGVPLPAFDFSGGINMAAASGKVAVLSSTTPLSGACPTGANINDFVGYGGATCFEGAAAAPGMDNLTADFRTHLGCKDSDSNGGNFVAGGPSPRTGSTPFNVCSGGDFEPEIFHTSPAANEAHIPLASNITIDFDEPVNVTGSWYQISCASGIKTAAVSGGPISFTLNPDSDFTYNEPCTVTVFASLVTDQDFADPPNNMAADYIFSFNSEFFRDAAEHMVMGNPSNATTNTADSTNFLMTKLQYALSYNDSRGGPNWTSWHLDNTWRGSAPRQDDFRADTTLPPGYHRVQGGEAPGEVNDFSGSGFDRGHMCPSADRTSTIADNSATFLMDNMLAQAPDNNQGPWAAFENYLRLTFLPGNEIYIISGGTGIGGTGSNGPANTIAGGFVTVPAQTWKVALILPVGDNDVSRVGGNARTIAVIMPNIQGIRSNQWQKYLATVDQVEALSTYDFYSSVPASIQTQFEALLDEPNDTAPVTSNQNKTTTEDQGVAVTLSATDFNVNNTFTFTVVEQPLHGSVSCSNGNCTYSPNNHYFGSDHFTYKANDGALDSNISTVNVTVTEVNNDPTAVNDSKQTAEDSSLNFPSSELTNNDSAGPGEGTQTLAVDSIISTPDTHGSIVLSGGQITYTPTANYNGPASFDYHMCDDGTTNGAADPKCAIGTVNVTVTEVNDTPSAVNDSKTTNEDTQLTFGAGDLTGNDSAGPANETGQILTVSTVTGTANTHGTVSLSSGQVSYTPAANYYGTASFEYEVCDNGTTNGSPDSKCATATVNLTISSINDDPDAVNDSTTVDEDSGANAIDVRANDGDVDGDTLTITAATQGTHGSVAITGGGTGVSYTPAANFFGIDTFTYTVSDGHGGTDTATVTVTVTNVQDAPDAVNDTATIAEDSGANAIAVLGNDTDADGDTLSVSAVTQGTHGSVAITGGGTGVSYTPAANFFGTDTFTYTVSDGHGGSDTATVTVTVTNVQDAPDAVNDTANIAEDSGANAVAVLGNDTDADGDTLSVSAVTQGTHGSVAITGDGTGVSYTPAANFFGTDTFTYTVSDGHGGIDTATVTVTVTNVQDAPDAGNDGATINEDSGVNTINVLGNDTDADGDVLSVSAVTQGGNGTVTNNGSSVSYMPNANFFGTDTFTYTVSDGHGGTDTATVTVTVTNVQDAPDAVNDAATINEDSGANAIDVRANDIDVDGDTLTVTAVTQGTHGSVAITGGTGVSYTPAANYFGNDSFTYTVSDGNGGTDTATVSITVANVNDAPVANNDNYTTTSNATLNAPAPGVLGNDSDIDGPSLSAQLVSNVLHGTLVLNANGSFSYTPSLNFTGTDSFSYRAFDGTANSNVATVTITIYDTVGPAVTVAVAVNSLWPANGDLINVGLTVSATDNSGGPVATQVFVFSDEDDVTTGGQNSPDAKDIAPNTLRLRAESSAGTDGRVYLIIVVATDSSGNVTRNYLTVVVPKGNSQDKQDEVAAEAAAARSYAETNGVPPAGYFVVGDGPVLGSKQ